MIKAKKVKKEYCCMYNCKVKLTKENKAKGLKIDMCSRCFGLMQNDNS